MMPPRYRPRFGRDGVHDEPGTCFHPGSHARRAVREALDYGLTVGELKGVLGGRSPTELVPPGPSEDPEDYGCRAASEILVRYILA